MKGSGARRRDAEDTSLAVDEEANETTPLTNKGAPGCHTSGEWPIASRWRLKQLPWQFLVSIFTTQCLLKGLVAGGGDEGLVGKPVEFLLGAQHVPAGRLQAMISIGGMAPWILKPILGFLSDMMPIMGYHKNSYIVLTTIFACLAALSLGSGLAATPGMIILSLFFVSLQVAMATLLVDAKQSEVVKARPECGPDLVAFKEVCMNSGMILSAWVVGPLITFGGPRLPYFVALPVIASLFILSFGNWLQEKRLVETEQTSGRWRQRYSPELFALGLLLVPLLLALAIGSALHLHERVLACVAVGASFAVVSGYMLFIRHEISGPVVWYFLVRCVTLQINGALFYFFTDSALAFPSGPHFTPFFYVSGVTSVAILGRLIGFMTAKDLFGNWHYGKALLLTMPLAAITQLMLVPLILRWNLALGIPDQVWVLVWTFLDMIARGWRHFPISIVLLQATPQGLEASSLALNTGAINMGTTVSHFLGSFALHLFNVQPAGYDGEQDTFSGLWKIQVGAALLPLLAIPLMPLLMPRRSQTERLLVESPESATYGAPWERFGARRSS
mmetsp:Transcript_23665/g.55191  ORF Transcript_23665/g.55191 Transcript_23665/m.55191 type:complete len:560 (+) Transcript_23665:134-1813(+)